MVTLSSLESSASISGLFRFVGRCSSCVSGGLFALVVVVVVLPESSVLLVAFWGTVIVVTCCLYCCLVSCVVEVW